MEKKKGNHEITESLYWRLPVAPETSVIPRVVRALRAPSVLVFALCVLVSSAVKPAYTVNLH